MLNDFKIKILGFLLIAVGLSCNKESGCEVNGLICSKELKTVSVEIKDSAGKHYVLDSYLVIPVETPTAVWYSKELDPLTDTSGVYVVLSDNEMNKVEKNGKYVSFKGIKNGVEVINEEFKIGHDCCHVVAITGKPLVILNK